MQVVTYRANPAPIPVAPRVGRLLPRIAVAAGIAVAVGLLAPQLRQLPAAVAAVGSADPRWLVAAAASAVVGYVAAAIALQAVTGARLPFGRNLRVQVAAAAAGAVTPAGTGGLALHVRFLEGYHVPRAEALAAVAVGRLVAAGMHVATLLLLAPRLASRIGALELPAALPVSIVLALVAGLALLRLGSPRFRRWSERLLLPLRGTRRALLADPRRIGALLAGAFGVSALRALTFAAALRSLGIGVPIVTVAALFLAAEALGALGGTPSGLGLLDSTLVTGVVAMGAAPAAGLAALMLFRLLTLWVPLVPGLLTLRSLRRGGHL
jgi:glycosyltransferase 2 family protein